MKNLKIIFAIFLFSIVSCDGQKSKLEKEIQNIQQNDAEHLDKIYKEAGDLITEISFELLATEKQKEDWPDGVIPWISLENTESEISQLVKPDEVVIPQKTVNLIIDYPLKKPANIVLSNPNGFTRKDLILEISKQYHKIYSEEEASAKTKTIPPDQRTGLINRNETDGKYGIWGHDLSDLDLSAVEVHQTKDGKINLILVVES